MIKNICLIIVLAPLLGAVIAGFFRNQIGRVGAHRLTIALVMISFIGAVTIAKGFLFGDQAPVNVNLYTWGSGGGLFPYDFHIPFKRRFFLVPEADQ